MCAGAQMLDQIAALGHVPGVTGAPRVRCGLRYAAALIAARAADALRIVGAGSAGQATRLRRWRRRMSAGEPRSSAGRAVALSPCAALLVASNWVELAGSTIAVDALGVTAAVWAIAISCTHARSLGGNAAMDRVTSDGEPGWWFEFNGN
jgi:hypothetical protein